ncbi:MAG: polysaccharide pyruvyl transferase family protein [Pirellulaceae bacterium]
MNRRTFLHTTLAAALTPWLRAADQRPPRIVLRSSWQTVNIGDIGHTPGVLALLEEYLPEAEVRLWPSSVDNGVDEMLRRRFPKVRRVEGADAIKAAFAECDFLLHGSGPSFVAEKDVTKWQENTGKPFGIYGITVGSLGAATIELMNRATFAFFRDSVSLASAKAQGVRCPVMDFGPDGAFGVDLRNEAPATAFLKANGLEDGKFLCCLSRLRHTPYWKVKKNVAFDEQKHARNEAMKEHDHAPLREAIIAVVRETPLRVLLCPEDSTQMEVGREMLYDKLPADVKTRVVWRDKYWLTDEAVSTYVHSAGIFGSEMHSPIMAVGNGIPAIVCRFAEQTSKGIMWRDIGLGDWLFDFDDDGDIQRLVPTVLAFAKDPAAAKTKAAKARTFVQQRQRETMAVLRTNLSIR